MKLRIKTLLSRLKNTGTLIATISAIILILNNLGIVIDSVKVMTIVNVVCGFGVAIGVLNNPTTPGTYIPLQKIETDK